MEIDLSSYEALEAAAKAHAASPSRMQSSAQFCADEAPVILAKGYDQAIGAMWLIKSLEYSVGVFHPDCKAAKAAWADKIKAAREAWFAKALGGQQ